MTLTVFTLIVGILIANTYDFDSFETFGRENNPGALGSNTLIAITLAVFTLIAGILIANTPQIYS